MIETHCMTVDLEDWYHIYPLEEWPAMTPRVVDLTRWLLDIFDSHGVRATFFILGYIAERHPELVADIAERGHHIGSHGYDHRYVFAKDPDEFRADIGRASDAITAACGQTPDIYRAPSFSITAEQSWVWDILLEHGIRSDSSLFGARRPNGGFPGIPRRAFRFGTPSGGSMTEYPVIPKTVGPLPVPFSGGTYFRLLPTRVLTSFLNGVTYPSVVYLHPRDLDPSPPDIPMLTRKQEFLYRVGTKGSRRKLATLLERFSFGSIPEIFPAEDIRPHDLSIG